jgi:hypothetical protein
MRRLYHQPFARADEFFKVRRFWANVKELQRTFHSRKSGHFKSRFCGQFASRLTVQEVYGTDGQPLSSFWYKSEAPLTWNAGMVIYAYQVMERYLNEANDLNHLASQLVR